MQEENYPGGTRGMSVEKVREYLAGFGMADRLLEFDVSSATVELAAKALNCEPGRIAKTMSFHTADGVILVVAAGDGKIDNRKFKDQFHTKARMLSHDEVEPLTGNQPGGVCPFGVPETVTVWLDESLRRFDPVYPAAGSASSAVRIRPEELETVCRAAGWVDVCKLPQQEE